MDIFESRYFYLNKWPLIFIGAWPYSSKRKLVRRLWFCMIAIMILPHIIALKVDFSVPVKLLEHVVVVSNIFIMFVKLLTLTLMDKKVKMMYEIMVENWKIIVDEDEKKILISYSNRGRYFTIAIFMIALTTCISFITFPLLPAFLYKLKILSTPQPFMYILNGEFFVDRESNYWKIYLFDCMTSFTAVAIYVSIDAMYRVCVEQCLALYAIITHRLSNIHVVCNDTGVSEAGNDLFSRILQIIVLHKRTLKFSQSLQELYSACFLVVLLANVIEIPLTCNIIIMTLHDDPVMCLRVTSVLIIFFSHLLWLYWPGQLLIDHSAHLSFYAYSSEWYRLPKESQVLIKVFMLRCREPVCLTAVGLINMNFENFASMVETALSYTAALFHFNK